MIRPIKQVVCIVGCLICIQSIPAHAQESTQNAFCDGPWYKGPPDGYTIQGAKRIGSCTPGKRSACAGFEITASDASPKTYRVVTFGFVSPNAVHDTLFTGHNVYIHQTDGAGAHNHYQTSVGEPLRMENVRFTDCAIFEYAKQEKSCFYGEYWDGEKCAAKAEADSTNNRTPGLAEDLFNAALAKSPEQLREESAASRARIDANTSSSSASGDSAAGMQALGALFGGYVAGRTGNTALLEAFTGQSTGSMAGIIPSNQGAMSSSAGSGQSGGNCDQVQQQIGNELTKVQAQYRSASVLCVQGPRQADVMQRYRPQLVQACSNNPQVVQYLDSQIRMFRQNASNSCTR